MPTRRPTGDLYIFHDYTYFATRKELLKLPSVTTFNIINCDFPANCSFFVWFSSHAAKEDNNIATAMSF